MAHPDPISALRSVDQVKHLRGIKGVYIFYSCLTGLIKIGRTYNIFKRHVDLSPFTSPHIIIAFYPSEEYGDIEKSFHYAHANRTVDREYFDIEIDQALSWFEALGLESIHEASKEEYVFQIIRANWIRSRIDGSKDSLTNYVNVITGIQYGRRAKR